MFYDILERKKAFQSYKNKEFKSRKIGNFFFFQGGYSMLFGPNLAMFTSFHFTQNRPRK